MINLPRHLSPWAPQLALFPAEMALALGAVVSRLASLIGGQRHSRTTEGEPDGYDGIARRGSYERLLPTEWLMLDEVPEEFLRRVVAGEHAFLRRAHTSQAAGKTCLALFDAGVDQLGAPRIAHLAMLILLAKRAAEQQAVLEWGLLQDAALTKHIGLTERSILRLVGARHGRSVSPEDVERWAGSLQGAQLSETWLVGAEPLMAYAPRLHATVVTVADVIEPEPPQRLHVQVAGPPSGSVKEAVLEVPEQRLAIQLLRDPFAATTTKSLASEAPIDPQSTLLFTTDSRRLYVRGKGPTLLAFHVPNSPRAQPGRTVGFAVPDGQVIIAAGWSPFLRRRVALSQQGQELFLHVLSKRGGTIARSDRFTLSGEYQAPDHGASTLRSLGALGRERYCFVDARGDLVELFEGEVRLRTNAAAITAKAQSKCFTWVTLRDGVPQPMWIGIEPGRLERCPTAVPDGLPPIDGAHNFRFGHGVGLFAYATSPTSWVIVELSGYTSVSIPDGLTVAGVATHGYPPDAGLITLDSAKTRIEFLEEDGCTETLVTTSFPITALEVNNTGNQIAFLTSAGELGVYSSVARAVVLRATGGGAP